MFPGTTRCERAEDGRGEYRAHGYEQILPYAVMALWLTVIVITFCPASHLPYPDSGVFLYIGEQILHHRLPYVDIFDHKGPVIFYLNALGLLIGHGSVWGVWIIEVVSLFSATYLGYRVIHALFGVFAAFWASLLWLISLLYVIEGGNLTEEYALALQFLCLYILLQFQQKKSSIWQAVLIGMATGMLFLLRANLIGIPLAIFLYATGKFFLTHDTKFRKLIAGIVCGVLLVAVIVLGYFGYRHALAHFWECAFMYNYSYIHTAAIQKVRALISGLTLLPLIPSLSIGSWCIVMYLKCTRRLPPAYSSPIISVCLLALPLELYLSSTSGRLYKHYNMVWLPTMTVFTGLCANIVYTRLVDRCGLAKSPAASRGKRAILISAMILLSLLPIYTPILLNTFSTITQLMRHAFTVPANSVAQAITKYTGEHDQVLILGGSYAGINYLAHRQSPTRFVYQVPLYDVMIRQRYVREFITDVMTKTPRLIVESPEVLSESSKYWAIPGMSLLHTFIETNYHVIQIVTENTLEWKILVRNIP